MKFLAFLLAIAGLIAMLLGWNEISRATADVSQNNLAVWLHTPHVGPGSTLDVEVKVYGGKEIGIRRLEIEGGAEHVVLKGKGEHWGDSIRSSSGYIASKSHELEVLIPPDAEPGSPLPLAVRVSYVLAARQDAKVIGGTFNNKDKTAWAKLSVPVLSTGERVLAHLLSFGRALLAFVLFTGLYVWLGPRLLKFNEPAPEGDDQADGSEMLILLGIAVVLIAGYVLMAQPMMAALAVSSTVLVVFVMLAWVFGPPVLAAFVHIRRNRQSEPEPAAEAR